MVVKRVCHDTQSKFAMVHKSKFAMFPQSKFFIIQKEFRSLKKHGKFWKAHGGLGNLFFLSKDGKFTKFSWANGKIRRFIL